MEKYIKIVESQKDELPKWKLFEYLAAIELNMLLWEDVGEEFIKKHNLPHKADYGIDLISADHKKTAQVKYYGEKSSVTWRDVSTYIAFSSHILKITDMTLITTNEAKVGKFVTRALPNIKRYDINELLAKDKSVQAGLFTAFFGRIRNMWA